MGLETLSVKRDIVPFSVRHDDTGVFGGASRRHQAAVPEPRSDGFGWRISRDWDL